MNEKELTVLGTLFDDKLKPIHDKLDPIHKAIYGEGDSDGLKVCVNKLKTNVKWHKAIGGVFGTAISYLIYDLFKRNI